MQERPGQIGDYWLSKRRGSEQWCRTWYDAATRQTRRESLGTADFQEGKLKLWEWFAKHGRIGQQQPQDAALAMVLVRYWERHAKALPSAEFARIALRYWSDFWGEATVAEITAARQREFIAALAAAGKSAGYVKRILTVGKAALNHAYREGEISTVPYVLPGEDAPMTDGWSVKEELDHVVDIVIDTGECGLEPTTVVDLSSGEAEVVRVGAGDPTPFE